MNRRVILVGNVGPKAARFSTENHLAREFETLGWTVDKIPEQPDCHHHVAAVLPGADLVWYVRTHGNGWTDRDACQLWDRCRKAGVPTVGFHLDRFVGIHRRDAKVSREYALFATDLVVTADGDSASEAAFAAAGVPHVWLPPAVVSDEVGIGTPQRKWAGVVAWVGSSRGYHPEWPRRGELVRALERRYRNRLVRAGDGVTVREQDLNDLYASVRVVAGDSLALARDESRYCSDRLFETPGRGGILVHPRMEPFVSMMDDAVVWSDWSVDGQLAVLDMVAGWSEGERRARREHAVAVVAGAHTYKHRILRVLDLLGLA